jgi:heat shock protein HtpX
LRQSSQKVFFFCVKEGAQVMNQLKTTMLLAALTAMFVGAGYALGGQAGIVIAIIFAGLMNFGAYWFSDRVVLRMYRAEEVSERDAPELYAMVRDLATRGGLPMPRVYIIPEETPNAFATGRNPEHAAVAVTAGIIEMLDREELRAVIAHELGHVRNRDTLIMTVAATIAGALSMLANLAMWGALFGGRSDDDEGGNPIGAILGIIFAPIAAALIQMAISRSREFMADEAGARLSENPRALASALRKIESYSKRIPIHSGTPATAHLFIINPFTAGGLAQLFSTHPSTEQRIERLESLAIQGRAARG